VAAVIDKIPDVPDGNEIERIEKALLEAKSDPKLRPLTVGGGKNFRRNYEDKIGLVAARLRAIYE